MATFVNQLGRWWSVYRRRRVALVVSVGAVVSVGIGVTLTAFGLLWAGVAGGMLTAVATTVAVLRHRDAEAARLAATVRAGLSAERFSDLRSLLDETTSSDHRELVRAAHAALVQAHSLRVENARLHKEMDSRIAEETQRVQARLKRLSDTDPLTGLTNRRGFDERLVDQIARARKNETELALLAIDVDHFKQLNDTCGHEKGDEALMALGEVVRACVREDDLAGRVGGDEIFVTLSGVTRVQAELVGHRIMERFSRHPLSEGHGVPWPTLSIGVTLLREDEAEGGPALRRMADRALYESKRQGRGRLTWWNEQLPEMSRTA